MNKVNVVMDADLQIRNQFIPPIGETVRGGNHYFFNDEKECDQNLTINVLGEIAEREHASYSNDGKNITVTLKHPNMPVIKKCFENHVSNKKFLPSSKRVIIRPLYNTSLRYWCWRRKQFLSAASLFRRNARRLGEWIKDMELIGYFIEIDVDIEGNVRLIDVSLVNKYNDGIRPPSSEAHIRDCVSVINSFKRKGSSPRFCMEQNHMKKKDFEKFLEELPLGERQGYLEELLDSVKSRGEW